MARRALACCLLLAKPDRCGAECAVDLLQRKLDLELSAPSVPHVLMIVADDLGWADLRSRRRAETAQEAQGWAETHTPNLDKLRAEGVSLERHYTTSSSPPSRCSLWSGRLPTHVTHGDLSVNHQMLWNKKDNNSGFDGIPRGMTGLGTKLKEAGYETHYVGKWDAGWATPEHTPLGRGFDSFLGFLQAENDYWSKDRGPLKYLLDICLNKFKDFSFYNATYRGGVTAQMSTELGCNATLMRGKPFTPMGCDMDNRSECLPETCYEEAMFLQHAKRIVQNHDKTKPLFLTFAHHLPHSPVSVPWSYMKKLEELVVATGVPHTVPWTTKRKIHAASLLYLDAMVGDLVQTFQEQGMYENTLLVFLSDNGAAANLRQSAHNYPLKGGKYADWEGGLRTNAFISGGFVPPEHRGKQFSGIFHIADWYATLCDLAGVDHVDHKSAEANKYLEQQGLPVMPPVDSRPQWRHLLDGSNARPDPLQLSEKTVLRWPYKLVTGSHKGSFWPGPVWPNCSTTDPVEANLDAFGRDEPVFNESEMRRRTFVEDCGAGCLFDVDRDPRELTNLATDPNHSALLAAMQDELTALNAKNLQAELGEEPAVEACLRAAEVGVLGPFADAEAFYRGVSPRPEAQQDKDEILAAQQALHKNPGLYDMVAYQIMLPHMKPDVVCLPETAE
eukprot:CAMPEP_0181411350 /NCGR_PEP_ID=MMETSP1110-20121109/7829_1 /TAXON_ID=174948 /ORGANISM="Symbiodinium sp., Strain CCMP421" /LENGTH=672 /DNA_ID=CAMNT_0023533965 /DNA_START=55 /DNA_END=2073 /DNA_ORIENTATION=-